MLKKRHLSRLTAIVLLAFCTAGCSQPLRTLMGLSAEQKAQRADVERQKSHFALLLKDIQRQRLTTGMTETAVVNRYGEPVLIKEGPAGRQVQAVWLYRDPVKLIGGTKVYLSFDAQKTLIDICTQDHGQ